MSSENQDSIDFVLALGIYNLPTDKKKILNRFLELVDLAYKYHRIAYTYITWCEHRKWDETKEGIQDFDFYLVPILRAYSLMKLSSLLERSRNHEVMSFPDVLDKLNICKSSYIDFYEKNKQLIQSIHHTRSKFIAHEDMYIDKEDINQAEYIPTEKIEALFTEIYKLINGILLNEFQTRNQLVKPTSIVDCFVKQRCEWINFAYQHSSQQ